MTSLRTAFSIILPIILFSIPCRLLAQHAIPFDDQWVVNGKTVSLPYAWNEDYAFRVNNADMPTDTVRYVKHFRLPKEARGKRVFIEFEAVRQAANVWINGHYVGLHEDGITAFGFDLTPYVHYRGDNCIEVLTDNSWDYREKATNTRYQWNDKNFNANYGGIRGHVRLHILGNVYQTLPLYSSFGTRGVYVYAKNFDVQRGEATVVVESEVRNAETRPQTITLQVTIDDQTFGSQPQTLQPNETRVIVAEKRMNLKFWAWRTPNLYEVQTSLIVGKKVVDSVLTVTGFRKTQFGPNGMLRLNDRVIMIHGYAQRTSNEWPAVGTCVTATLSDYSNRLMVESGANLVRWMHTMPWRQDIESCDRVGLMQAMPAGDAEKDATGRQWEQRIEVMRDAIVYNRNNPSVVFYECGNRGISEEHMQEMKALRDTFDPHGGRAIGSREMLGQNTAAEYGGEMLYINKSGGKPLWAMEYCRDEGLRRYWDAWSPPYFHPNGAGPLYRGEPATAYNLNQDQLAVEHVRRWYDYWQVRPGTGRRVSSGGVKIIFSDTNTHCRGESNYRTSGVVDAVRLPKDSFYAHRIMWNGWVDPETPEIYIMGHWNYPTGTVKPIYVVSNTDSVVLLMNGRPLQPLHREYHFLWTCDSVNYTPGTLQAIGYQAGKAVCEYTLHTAGEAKRLKLSVVCADQDMALVQCEAIDADGRRCPTDHRHVSFSLDGNAEWRGGIGDGENNCILHTTLPLECGVTRAIVRLRNHAGTATLTALADGLPAETISLTPEINTPSSSSIQTTVISTWRETADEASVGCKVADVSVSGNADTAQNAIDDDETTEWRASNSPWITFHFAEECRPQTMSVKFANWRRSSYPIEVSDDAGNILYRGSTPRSLGYVNLPLQLVKPTHSVTIRLIGQSTDNEAFAAVTELADKTQTHTASPQPKDELRIIECDFSQGMKGF